MWTGHRSYPVSPLYRYLPLIQHLRTASSVWADWRQATVPSWSTMPPLCSGWLSWEQLLDASVDTLAKAWLCFHWHLHALEQTGSGPPSRSVSPRKPRCVLCLLLPVEGDSQSCSTCGEDYAQHGRAWTGHPPVPLVASALLLFSLHSSGCLRGMGSF